MYCFKYKPLLMDREGKRSTTTCSACNLSSALPSLSLSLTLCMCARVSYIQENLYVHIVFLVLKAHSVAHGGGRSRYFRCKGGEACRLCGRELARELLLEPPPLLEPAERTDCASVGLVVVASLSRASPTDRTAPINPDRRSSRNRTYTTSQRSAAQPLTLRTLAGSSAASTGSGGPNTNSVSQGGSSASPPPWTCSGAGAGALPG
jgi:hypothetical protein